MVAMATSKRRIRGSSLTFHTYAYTFKSFVGAARTDYLETSEGYLVDLWGSELFSEWDWERNFWKLVLLDRRTADVSDVLRVGITSDA
jgi:hypothetical protein